ncbi:MAG: hypothetical protein HKO59_00400 [Phycisphaerales bacterium]|nr:hypothetical protein [Phycisphaerales bacterium]
MRRTSRIAGGLAAVVIIGVAAVGADEFNYVKRDTRRATREATLAQYTTPLELGAWYVIGPFDNAGRDKHDIVYPPEVGIDLAASYEGKDGRLAAWEEIPDDAWMKHDLKRFGDEAANTDGIAYLARRFTAPRDGVVTFQMGSDDGLKVWLNGRLHVDADVYRGFNIQDHTVELPIRAGENTLLVKVTQGVGGWDFQMMPVVDPRLLTLLEYHLNRDFPESPELRHYQMMTILEPPSIVLEVGGLAVMPDGRPVVTTRRGDAFVVENAYEVPPFNAVYKRFASGLHEPLGAAWDEDGLLVVQRGELTRLVDVDGDDRADRYETVSEPWGVSGNYHEFAFGPERDGQGRWWVTLNVGFCGSLGKSLVPWRGWALIVEEDGALTPVCGGLRSPNGLGRNAAGDMFCCDNQGDWVATNKMMHLDFGDWHGHPAGDTWYDEAGMAPPRGEEDFKPPAIWFPYDRVGRSASDILLDDTGGKFGPFEGQLFVGDQYEASIARVFLERVDGVYQGACFRFLKGLDSGVNRLAWAPDGSLLVGMTNRGWWSHGPRAWGLQRVVYTHVEPFEIKTVEVQPDGFLLTFTGPVDEVLAAEAKRYDIASFTYERWEKYGAPEIDRRSHAVTSCAVSRDGRSVRLRIDGLRAGRVVEISLDGVVRDDGASLVHPEAYYTLNVIPSAPR